ncbi:MAG: multiubiquitin domain-containing protein [Roseovarius sp.]|nr:multiubiquitin domain-containing protein [Roseovarius sp.]MCY4206346.1 multiubiquitin domain-containing protein [Roseovarius sp.]MCY4316171.1 multiubiquitin domain-containing protein [Roseovarius sp.]
MKTGVEIDGERHEVTEGLISAQVIYELIGCEEGRLFFSQSDEIDIPLDSSSFLVIKGQESFVTGESQIEDNPSLRNSIQLRFNGKPGPVMPRAKVTGKELKAFDAAHSAGRLFLDIGNGPDVEIADDMRILVQEGNLFFVIPAGDNPGVGEPIDVEECSRHGRAPPKGQNYRIRIDREKCVVKEEKVTGTRILALVNKNPEEWALNQKFGGGKRERIEADGIVDVSQPGLERFETVRRQAQQGRE